MAIFIRCYLSYHLYWSLTIRCLLGYLDSWRPSDWFLFPLLGLLWLACYILPHHYFPIYVTISVGLSYRWVGCRAFSYFLGGILAPVFTLIMGALLGKIVFEVLFFALESLDFPLEGGVVCILGGGIFGILFHLIGYFGIGIYQVCDGRPVFRHGLDKVCEGLLYSHQVFFLVSTLVRSLLELSEVGLGLDEAGMKTIPGLGGIL